MAYWLDESWDNCAPVARAGNACFGLYVRCGIWAARNTSDGFVPAEIAAAYGSPEQARKLVDVGLWAVAEGGYVAVHYLELNPSATKVEARRKADAARKARWRATRDKTRESGRSHGVTDGGTPRFPDPPKGGRDARGNALRAVPPWCGRCNKDNRMFVDDSDTYVPCPNCHPNPEALTG